MTKIPQTNECSVQAFRLHYNTDNPRKNKETILSTMFRHNRPLTYDEIAEYSGQDRTAMGQYIGRDLMNEGLVFKVKSETGLSKKKNKASLYVTKKYIYENQTTCPEVENDPRLPLDSPQFKMF